MLQNYSERAGLQDIVRSTRARIISVPAIWWIIALAVALRLVGCSRGFDDDEVFDVSVASHALGAIPALLGNDFHPPLYFFFLHEWLRLGHSEMWVRAPSTALGVATIGMTYALVGRLTSRPTAIAAALLVAISPYHLIISTWGKMYALMLFLALGAAWALQQALEGDRKWWAAYALAALLLVYSHNLGGFVVVGTALWGLLVCLQRRRGLGLWVSAHLFILIGYLPWVPTLVHQVTADRPLSAGVRPPTEYRAWSALWFYWTAPYLPLPDGLRVKMTLPFLALAMVGLLWIRRHQNAVLPLLALGAVPFLLAVVLGFVGFPVFLGRALPSVWIVLYTCVAASLVSLRGNLQRSASLVVAAFMLVSLVVFLHTPREDWRDVAQYVRGHTSQLDAVAASEPFYAAALGHYWTPPPRVAVWPLAADVTRRACAVWMVDKNGPAYAQRTYRATLSRLFGEPEVVYVGPVPVIHYARKTATGGHRCQPD